MYLNVCMQPRLHAPYHPDPHHGEALFRQSKGHEREEYEEAEAYASPDDVNPEVYYCMIN